MKRMPETRSEDTRGSPLLAHLQRMTGQERNDASDALLAQTLCFIAGVANAGGFLAIGQYTSHMSGIASAIADNLALGSIGLVLGGLAALFAFVAGAACSAVLINWGRRHRPRHQFTVPLLLEALLILCFGLLGAFRDGSVLLVTLAVPLLCFIMGLQNAIITKISQARMRTTHVTGIVTDIGIEIGKLLYWNRSRDRGADVNADKAKLCLLVSLLSAFVVGGILGALGFTYLGFITTVPLAMMLMVLAASSLLTDLIGRTR